MTNYGDSGFDKSIKVRGHGWQAMLLLCLAGCAPQTGAPFGEVVDLTHPFDADTVYWPTAQSFRLTVDSAGFTDKGYYYAANSFCAAEHGGTHIDAPIHFSEKGQSVDEIPLHRLMGPAVVVDVTAQCASDRDYQIRTSDFQAWEKKQGQRLQTKIILLRTGFGKHYPDRDRYMGTSQRGRDAVAQLHFPGLHPDAARWLAKHRSIKAIGLDTPSIDFGQSTHFESHVVLFAESIPVFENLAELNRLPTRGFDIVALPIKIRGGSGGPLRIIALLH